MQLSGLDGIIVPGGFGDRGIAGMITATNYARTHNLPFFGICLGMQIAVIEYARNVAGMPDANSGEFNEQCAHKVIDFMPGQSEDINKGGHPAAGQLSLRHYGRHHHGALLRQQSHPRAPPPPL